MVNQTKKLFEGFPAVSTEQWEQQIQKDLKGADYAKKLLWKTDEGLVVKPYYRSEDLETITWINALPNQFPFVRGNKISGNEWLVRQDFNVSDFRVANEQAREVLNKGVNALGFRFAADVKLSSDIFEQLLLGISPETVEINLMLSNQHLEAFELFEKWIEKNDYNKSNIRGSINFDPLTRYIRRGVWFTNQQTDIETAAKLIKAAKEYPQFDVIGINAHIFTNAGATIVQEMAIALAVACEYCNLLSENGLSVSEIVPAIRFNAAVGPNYFMEIAKIRAYRLLWATILKAYKVDPQEAKMYMHATNASFNMSVYDAYANMLRTTTGSMSAILGGVDSFTVKPFNAVFEKTTTFSERVARNQQLVLKEESGFDKVADPSAGSYYVENLTASIADAVWELFLKIDQEGGYLTALRNGSIQKQIKESAQIREKNIATRRETILGTNQFPNFSEAIKTELVHSVFEADDRRDAKAEIDTIATFRAAQQFETMRYQTDVYSKTNKRPTAWMLTFGNLNMRKARANFASNFFACAGFEVIDNPGFKTAQEGIEAAKAIKPEIVVICSSDEEYTDNALQIFEALKNNAIIVLAGYPTDLIDTLKAAGMEHFIHVKSNVLETLRQFQKQLGVTK